MKFRTLIQFLTVFATSLVLNAAQAQLAPDAQVKAVATEITALLKVDPTIINNPAKVKELIESKLVPNFDFKRMTQLAMGRNWRSATPEQQTALMHAFQTLLVRTYSGALANFRNNNIDYRPLRVQPTDTDVTVKTVVSQPNGQGIAVDYSLTKAQDGSWKAYDVVVAGVSLVTNYREEFAATVRDGGIDGLIARLQAKNK